MCKSTRAVFVRSHSGEESVLHGVEHSGPAGGKVHAALQVAGIRRAQGAVAGDLDGAALGKASGGHDHFIGVARFVGRFRRGKAVDGAVVLDARAEAGEGFGAAGVEAGDDVVVVRRVARHRADPRQFQQALGVDGCLEGLAHNARGVVQPQEGIPQIEKIEAKKLMLPSFGDEKWENFHLKEWLNNSGAKKVDYWTNDLSRMENENLANDADIAIGFADYLIANTGTITVTVSPEQGRGFNFLPTHYLALVPKSGLVPSTRVAVENYEKRLGSKELETSAINFISGPSNSGDIEMELVVGVHGPLDCTYLVVEDM